MSDDKKSRAERAAEVRERLGDAIGNGQIHPALADYLALVDDELQGAAARHQALVDDLAADKTADPEPEEPDDKPKTAAKATPAAVAKQQQGGSSR